MHGESKEVIVRWLNPTVVLNLRNLSMAFAKERDALG
jgi:hypothetical protein